MRIVDKDSHRVDRVLSFFSSRPNWDSPTPSHAGECVYSFLLFGSGRRGMAHSLAGEEGGGSLISDEGTGTLVLFVLCDDSPFF
jgi:hypothetical protein